MTDDWRTVNLANWESRVPMHTGPDGYDLASFDDPEYLSGVVIPSCDGGSFARTSIPVPEQWTLADQTGAPQ